MDASPLRRRVLAAIASAAGLIALPVAGCGSKEEPKQTYTDGGEPISVPTSSCTGQSEVQCYAPESLPRINQGNRPIDPDAAPPPPPPEPPRDANRCVPTSFVQDGCCNTAATGPVFDGKACCYRFCTGSCCGRPLIVEGTPRIAATASRDDWARTGAAPAAPCALDDTTRAALADAWLADAQMEHASIASFARFTLDLLTHGAPPELVVASQSASLDEVTHARLGFSIASRLAGRALGPGRMDLSGAVAGTTLAAAATAAVREGCIGETIAAMLAQDQHRNATDDEVRAALETIAADEARHAELAWQFVAWAIRHGGPDVRVAVDAAFRDGLAALPLPAPPPPAIESRCLDGLRPVDSRAGARPGRGRRSRRPRPVRARAPRRDTGRGDQRIGTARVRRAAPTEATMAASIIRRNARPRLCRDSPTPMALTRPTRSFGSSEMC